MYKFEKLASEIRELAYELEVFGVEKTAAANKLYEYEIEGFKFYSSEKMPSGIRLPVGKAKYTKNFFTTTGELSKVLDESVETKKAENDKSKALADLKEKRKQFDKFIEIAEVVYKDYLDGKATYQEYQKAHWKAMEFGDNKLIGGKEF